MKLHKKLKLENYTINLQKKTSFRRKFILVFSISLEFKTENYNFKLETKVKFGK